MSVIYKYLAMAMGGMSLALMLGAYFYRGHQDAGMAQAAVNAVTAKLNASAASELQAALQKQQIEAALALKASQNALQAAQNTAATAQTQLTGLQAKLKAIANEPDVKAWDATCIPDAIRSSVQFSPDCPSH